MFEYRAATWTSTHEVVDPHCTLRGVLHSAINTATRKILLCGGHSVDPEGALKLTAAAGCTVGFLLDWTG